MMQMATVKAKGAFRNLNKKLLQERMIAFKDSCHKNINVFIGGEIHYCIKIFVNHSESSFYSATTRNMKFRDEYLNLQMIEKVSRSRVCGINVIQLRN